MNDPELPPPEGTTEPNGTPVGFGPIASSSIGTRSGSGRLFTAGLVATAALLFYYAFTAKVEDPIHLYLGLMIIVGAMYPALQWARRKDDRFPVFEVLMLTCVNTYAIPLLSGQHELQGYSNDTITSAAFGVLLYQMVSITVYATTRGRPKTTSTWTQEVITHSVTDYLAIGMMITTAYTIINLLTNWIPYDLNGPIRAVCYGIGIISTFIQSRMWGQGTFPHYRKAAFVLQLALQVIFSWAALFLIGGISILVLALLGYISGGKKLPVLALAIVLPILGVLHNGKSQMREKYWDGGAPSPTLTTLPAFFSEWIEYGLHPESDDDPTKKRHASKLLERTSLFHIMCLVVDCTPSREPMRACRRRGPRHPPRKLRMMKGNPSTAMQA